jgi:hypothetical protein
VVSGSESNYNPIGKISLLEDTEEKLRFLDLEDFLFFTAKATKDRKEFFTAEGHRERGSKIEVLSHPYRFWSNLPFENTEKKLRFSGTTFEVFKNLEGFLFLPQRPRRIAKNFLPQRATEKEGVK